MSSKSVFWIVLSLAFGILALIAHTHRRKLEKKLEQHKGRGTAISTKDGTGYVMPEWELYDALKHIFIVEVIGFTLASVAAIGTLIFP